MNRMDKSKWDQCIGPLGVQPVVVWWADKILDINFAFNAIWILSPLEQFNLLEALVVFSSISTIILQWKLTLLLLICDVIFV